MPNFEQIYAKTSELWAINWIQNGGRHHFEFTTVANFGHITYFLLWLATPLQNVIILAQTVAELLAFLQKSKMAVAAILDLICVQYYSQFACRTIKWVHVPNFVQTYAITSELWAINWIQDGCCRHLEFTTVANFGHITYFLLWLATLLQNFIILTHKAAELLVFVQKSKMAAAAILDLSLIHISEPTRPY